MLRNEKGLSMLFTIGLILLISVLGVSLMTLNVNSMKMSKHEKVNQSVYYVAEAGINYHVTKVEQLVEQAFVDTQNHYDGLPLEQKATFNFKEAFLSNAKTKIDHYIAANSGVPFKQFVDKKGKEATVVITYNNNNHEVHFTATGKLNNQNRTLQQTLEINVDNLYTKKEVITGEHNTGGNNSSSSNTNPPVELTSNPIVDELIDDGNKNTHIYVYGENLQKSKKAINGKEIPVGTFDNDLHLVIKNNLSNHLLNLKSPPDGVKVDLNANPTTVIKETSKVKDIQNYTQHMQGPLEIDSSNEAITLYVSGDFTPKVSFKIKGGNPVNIVIMGNAALDPGFQLESIDTEVNLIVTNSHLLNINNSGNGNNKKLLIQGNLFLGSTTNLNHNKADITGSLISLEPINIHLNGSANFNIGGICAPYATFSSDGKFNITNGGIVVKEISKLNGSQSIVLNSAFKQNICSSSILNPLPPENVSPEKALTVYTYTPNKLSVLHGLIEE